MRILLLNYLDTSKPGGISKVVREFGDGLIGLGHTVKMIQPMKPDSDESGEYYGFRDKGLIQTLGLHHYRIGDIGRIINHIREFAPEVINIHGSRNILSPLTVINVKRAFPDIPLIYSPHHDSKSGVTFSGKYLFWLHKILLLGRAYQNADMITVCSEFEELQVSNSFVGRRDKIRVIPNGIDDPVGIMKEITERDKLIISAGYLFELKGIHHVIRALREIHDRGMVEWKMVICGDGPFKGHLKRLVSRLGLEESVELKGFVSREELVSLMGNARVATLISRSENYGIFAAECLSSGIPTVVTDSTALSEFGWVDWCLTVPEPVETKILAERILQASMCETKVIINQKNLVSWERTCEILNREIELIS